MGAGPEALVEGGLFDRLSSDGLDARLRVVELGGSSRHEVASAFELAGLISEGVRSSLNAGAFPLVLSGNCNGCVGALGGLGGKDPERSCGSTATRTSTLRRLRPVALRTAWGSIAVGHCWRGMAARVPDFEPVPEANAVLVGAREIEPGERERLLASGVGVVAPKTGLLEELDAALVGLSERVRGVYLHTDLDVLDPATVGKANEFAPAGGLTVEEVE